VFYKTFIPKKGPISDIGSVSNKALIFDQITTLSTGPGQCFWYKWAEDTSPGTAKLSLVLC